jgi:alanine or glycine:cation symporter, AGCS family
MIKLITERTADRIERYISSFQAFCIGAAGRVRTGNMAGGPEAVFWMWCVALVSASTAFIEITLAQIYKNLFKIF